MIIDASIDVEYSDDCSIQDDDGGSSYSSPFRLVGDFIPDK